MNKRVEKEPDSQSCCVENFKESAIKLVEVSTTNEDSETVKNKNEKSKMEGCDQQSTQQFISTSGSVRNDGNPYAVNRSMVQGLMDIALLSANANQLRFLLAYNQKSSTYYVSLTLVILSLCLQIIVGVLVIFQRHSRRCRGKRFNKSIICGVFMVSVVNILLAAFTTVNDKNPT